jgi:hypothetical protein
MWVRFKGGGQDGGEINLPEPLPEFEKIPNTHSTLPIRMDGELYRLHHEPDGTPFYDFVREYDDTPARLG